MINEVTLQTAGRCQDITARSLSIKIALTVPSRFTQRHWEMAGCKTLSTQKTPEMVAQARLLGPSIHAVVGMVTYRIPHAYLYLKSILKG